MLQVSKVGFMILEHRKAKPDIRDLLFKQGMKISIAWWGSRIDESDPHRRYVVGGGGSIRALTRSSDVISWKKKLWRQLTTPHDRLFNHDDKTRIVIHFWRKTASDNVQLCQLDLETIILILMSIWLDCEQQSENMTLVLLGLDSDEGLNRKDIEGFILFATDIHVPSSNQWFRRYALVKLLKFCDE
jgi:hypothetical protein